MACHTGFSVPATRRWPTAQSAPKPDIGLLLPCNVVVRAQADGRIVVAFMDPVAVMQFTENADVRQIAQEVRARLQRVRAALVPV